VPEFATYPTLRDKTVLITGGASGIGAAIVEHFAAQGARTAFIDIDAEAGAALTARLASSPHRPHFVAADLRGIEALQAAIQQVRGAIGPLKVLVNNAARDDRHGIDSVNPVLWDDLMAANLRHQFFCAQAVREDMAGSGGGSIVNLGSVSWMWGLGGMPVYLTAKAGIAGLTRALARDFGLDRIRVNSVVPGFVATERQMRLWMSPDGLKAMLDRQCLKDILQPDDIARMVLFLAADDSRLCTAQNFIVDGGAT
jgi:NAD(P)-dependent dehydrogenase (short-subunit alcohol dehydrogenase family)